MRINLSNLHKRVHTKAQRHKAYNENQNLGNPARCDIVGKRFKAHARLSLRLCVFVPLREKLQGVARGDDLN